MKIYVSNAAPALYYYLYNGLPIYINGFGSTPAGGSRTYEVKGHLYMTLAAAKRAVNNINAGKGY